MTINWKNTIQVILFALLFLAFLVLSLSAIKKRKLDQSSTVNVEFSNKEIKFIDAKEIRSIIGVEVDSLQADVLESIDLNEIENKVKSSPYVDNCEAFINHKKQLGFRVQQKEPVFRVFNNSAANYYVDKHGKKFPKSPTFTANVPIVTGRVGYELDSLGLQKSESIHNLLKLFEYAEKDEAIKALITAVDVQSNGDLLITPRLKYHQINIGNAQNLEEKFKRLKIFYKEGLSKIGWEKYSLINLKYAHQVIAKKK